MYQHKIKHLFVVIFILINISGYSQNTIGITENDKWLKSANELYHLDKYETGKLSYKIYTDLATKSLNKTESEFYYALSSLFTESNGELLVLNFIEKNPEFTLNNLAYYELGSLYFSKKNHTRASEFFTLINTTYLL